MELRMNNFLKHMLGILAAALVLTIVIWGVTSPSTIHALNNHENNEIQFYFGTELKTCEDYGVRNKCGYTLKCQDGIYHCVTNVKFLN